MDLIKNIHFTLLIRLGKQLHEFNFRKRSEDLYDGDTNDDRGNRYYFKMIKEEKSWKPDGKNIPDWITKNQNLISDALLKKETE